jgi:hypothetical protein
MPYPTHWSCVYSSLGTRMSVNGWSNLRRFTFGTRAWFIRYSGSARSAPPLTWHKTSERTPPEFKPLVVLRCRLSETERSFTALYDDYGPEVLHWTGSRWKFPSREPLYSGYVVAYWLDPDPRNADGG